MRRLPAQLAQSSDDGAMQSVESIREPQTLQCIIYCKSGNGQHSCRHLCYICVTISLCKYHEWKHKYVTVISLFNVVSL